MPSARRSPNPKQSPQPQRPPVDAVPPSQPAAATCVNIEGPLTIAEARHWHGMLVAQFAGSGAVSLDLSRMTATDAIGLQLLCAARRTAVAESKTFHLQGAGPVLFAACEAAGLVPAELGVSES